MQPTQVNSPSVRLTGVILGCLGLAASAQATVLINDDFSDGDRIGWVSVTPANTSVTAQQLVFDPNANEMVITYFTPTTLTSGQSLRLSFDFTLSGAVPVNTSYFRVGYFNSNGATPKVDSFAVTSFEQAGSYAGSAALLNLTGTGASSVTYRHRNLSNGTNVPAGGNALTTNLGNYVAAEPGATGGTASAFTVGSVYRVTYTFAEGGASDTLSLNIFDVTANTATSVAHSYTTTATTSATFDLLAFNFQGATTPFTFDNVVLEVIPEPASAAALAGLGTLGLALLRRRRR
jgi:hypothetical protein